MSLPQKHIAKYFMHQAQGVRSSENSPFLNHTNTLIVSENVSGNGHEVNFSVTKATTQLKQTNKSISVKSDPQVIQTAPKSRENDSDVIRFVEAGNGNLYIADGLPKRGSQKSIHCIDGIQEKSLKRKKSRKNQIITGSQIVHQPGKRALAQAQREIVGSMLFQDSTPVKTPKSVTRTHVNPATRRQQNNYKASMLAAAAAFSPPRPPFTQKISKDNKLKMKN